MYLKAGSIFLLFIDVLTGYSQVSITNISLAYPDTSVLYGILPNMLRFSGMEKPVSRYTYRLNGGALSCEPVSSREVICPDVYMVASDSAVVEVFYGKKRLLRQVFKMRFPPVMSVTLASQEPGAVSVAGILNDPLLRQVLPGYIHLSPYQINSATIELTTGSRIISADVLPQMRDGEKLPANVLETIAGMKAGDGITLFVDYALDVPSVQATRSGRFYFRIID